MTPRTLQALISVFREWDEVSRDDRAIALAEATHHLVARGRLEWAKQLVISLADRAGYPDSEDIQRWLEIIDMHERMTPEQTERLELLRDAGGEWVTLDGGSTYTAERSGAIGEGVG